MESCSVVDPYHFDLDLDLDPDPERGKADPTLDRPKSRRKLSFSSIENMMLETMIFGFSLLFI